MLCPPTWLTRKRPVGGSVLVSGTFPLCNAEIAWLMQAALVGGALS